MNDDELQHRLDLGLDILRVGQTKIAAKQLSRIVNFERRNHDFDIINKIGEAASVCMTELEQHDFWKKILAVRLHRIKGIIPAEILQKKKVLVWFFDRGQAMGHLGREPWFMKHRYADEYDEIVIVGKPRSENVNTAVFDIMMDGVTYIETSDYSLIELSRFNVGLINIGNIDFYIYSYPYVCTDFLYNTFVPKKFEYLELDEAVVEKGYKVRQKLGIPDDAKIAILHVRENSRGQLQRDVNIVNYFDAIKTMISDGYFVIRIGDCKMPSLPLEEFGSNLIDAPYNQNYDPVVEPYFINECEFMISSASGPDEFARCLGKRMVVINGDIHFCHLPSELELMAFLKYKHKDTDKYISYQEFLENDYYTPKKTEDFDELGIETEQLTSNEIVAVIKEMIKRVEGKNNLPSSTDNQKKFEQISSEEHEKAFSKRKYKWIDRHRNWFGMGFSAGRFIISEAYCEFCPWFLENYKDK
jgi:putative glycosyltransferase (TIGR04372 family)